MIEREPATSNPSALARPEFPAFLAAECLGLPARERDYGLERHFDSGTALPIEHRVQT